MRREFLKLTGLIILASFLTIICEERQAEISPGLYQYQGFGVEDQKVTDCDTIITVDKTFIKNQKNIQIMALETDSQLDAGEGPIEDRIQSGGAIYIRLAYNKGPNMILRGHFKDRMLSGKRFIESLAGTISAGTFNDKR
ncbi:hypothetical protein JNL27_04200 [bacterium]|nr:hypothetical protein [bacterium]